MIQRAAVFEEIQEPEKNERPGNRAHGVEHSRNAETPPAYPLCGRTGDQDIFRWILQALARTVQQS